MIHNQISYGTDFIRAIGRASGLGTNEEGTGRLGETLTPVLDIWSRPEWLFLAAERLCAFSGATGALAGEYSGLALVNPAGSPHLVIVEQAGGYLAAALELSFQVVDAATIAATYGSSQGGFTRDRRWAQTTSAARVFWGTDAVNAIGQVLERSASPPIYFRSVPLVLPAGQGALVIAGAVNLSFFGYFAWRERLALPNER